MPTHVQLVGSQATVQQILLHSVSQPVPYSALTCTDRCQLQQPPAIICSGLCQATAARRRQCWREKLNSRLLRLACSPCDSAPAVPPAAQSPLLLKVSASSSSQVCLCCGLYLAPASGLAVEGSTGCWPAARARAGRLPRLRWQHKAGTYNNGKRCRTAMPKLGCNSRAPKRLILASADTSHSATHL